MYLADAVIITFVITVAVPPRVTWPFDTNPELEVMSPWPRYVAAAAVVAPDSAVI